MRSGLYGDPRRSILGDQAVRTTMYPSTQADGHPDWTKEGEQVRAGNDAGHQEVLNQNRMAGFESHLASSPALVDHP